MQGLKEKEWFKILIGAAFIILISVSIGVLANISLIRGSIGSECPPLSASHSALLPKPSLLDLAEAKKKFAEGQAIFIDARCPDEYNWGHIKGAINLPVTSLETVCPSVIAQLSPEREIITYCSGTDCRLSIELAQKLVKLGFLKVNIFFGGWPSWEAAGYPVEPEN